MTRDELRRRIFEDIIDYMNEPYNNGTINDVANALECLCAEFIETLEFYTDFYGEHIELPLYKMFW